MLCTCSVLCDTDLCRLSPVSLSGVRRPHQGAERLPGTAAGEGGGNLRAESREEQHQGEDERVSVVPIPQLSRAPFSSLLSRPAYLNGTQNGNETTQSDNKAEWREIVLVCTFACIEKHKFDHDKGLVQPNFPLCSGLENLAAPSQPRNSSLLLRSITGVLRCPPAPTMPCTISLQFRREDHDPLLSKMPSGWAAVTVATPPLAGTFRVKL